MRQVDENYSPVQLEKDIRAMWDRTRTYDKVKKASESGKAYYILDGPPYTTGSIHIGTARNKVLKDTVIRFRRMQGLNVRDQPGYDMHGLPIEVKVEQALNIKSKKEIEEQGMEKFIETVSRVRLEVPVQDDGGVQAARDMDGLGPTLHDRRPVIHRIRLVDPSPSA